MTLIQKKRYSNLSRSPGQIIYTKDNLITIPGRYDDLDPITQEQKENNQKILFDESELKYMT